MHKSTYANIRDVAQIPSFHDAELIGIEHRPDDRELVLRFRRVAGEIELLRFTEVKALRIVDFAEQNVASRLLITPKYQFSSDEACTWVQWVNSRDDAKAAPIDDEQAKKYVCDFAEGRKALFVLEPSCGAEMAVLCETVWLMSA
jgi:hypothetical protein